MALQKAERRGEAPAPGTLGALPEWDLSDLYPALDSPQLLADLDRAAKDCVAFETRYKGELEKLARADTKKAGGGGLLAKAVREFEALEELIGRIYSFAGLVHAGDTSDPALSKFFGDIQEQMTQASSHLLFFALELNRIDDEVLDGVVARGPLKHYAPWLADMRKERPYQLDERTELLFHEKSVTGRSAWNRLFDETMTALRFDIGGEKLAIEPALKLLLDEDETVITPTHLPEELFAIECDSDATSERFEMQGSVATALPSAPLSSTASPAGAGAGRGAMTRKRVVLFDWSSMCRASTFSP